MPARDLPFRTLIPFSRSQILGSGFQRFGDFAYRLVDFAADLEDVVASLQVGKVAIELASPISAAADQPAPIDFRQCGVIGQNQLGTALAEFEQTLS